MIVASTHIIEDEDLSNCSSRLIFSYKLLKNFTTVNGHCNTYMLSEGARTCKDMILINKLLIDEFIVLFKL